MSEAPLVTPEQDSPTIIIDQATPSDVEDIVEIRKQGWLSAYPNEELGITEDDIRKRIEGEHGEVIRLAIERWREGLKTETGLKRTSFVARLNGKVVGFTAPRITDDSQRRVGALYVLPEAQGSGVGTKLLQSAVDWHGRDNDIYLHVVSYNQKAIDFYEHFGFEKTGQEILDDHTIGDNKVLPEIEMVLRASESKRNT